MKELYSVCVYGDSYSCFEEYYSEEEVEIIQKFIVDMSKNGVANWDVPCISFEKID